MKRSPYFHLIPLVIVFLVLGVVLYFLHPLAPLLLLASLVIQLPLVWGITRNSYNKGYRQRSEARAAQFREDGDAEAWLAMEEKEAESLGYRYLSEGSRSLNLLNRAQLLHLLGREKEATALFVNIQPQKLRKPSHAVYDTLGEQLKLGAERATVKQNNRIK